MADQFVVPQFIDVESKIIGPVKVRQFVILLTASFIIMIFYKLFDFSLFLLTSIPTFVLAIAFSVVKINGQGLHMVMLNVIQVIRRPSIRVWNKYRTDEELKAKITKKTEVKEVISLKKPPLGGSHLRDLSLVVNTGGVYIPDADKPEK